MLPSFCSCCTLQLEFFLSILKKKKVLFPVDQCKCFSRKQKDLSAPLYLHFHRLWHTFSQPVVFCRLAIVHGVPKELNIVKRLKQHQTCLSHLQTPAAAAKSLQSCLTLCDPIDGSPPGSPVPGILQARTLEWVAISFSNPCKWKVKVKSFSRVWLVATPWTAAH